MGIGTRYFLFQEDGEPLRLSHRLVEGMSNGSDALPQFAGTRQRILYLALDTENREPAGIFRHEGHIWSFDDEGRISESLRQSFAEAMDIVFASRPEGNVVALAPKINRKRHDQRHRWEPTAADIQRAADDIWRNPGTKALKQAQGVSKRRPPLTMDAKFALEEIRGHFFKIQHPLWDLSEPALKGLAFEAHSRAENGDDPELYRAVAEIAEAKLRRIERRKSAKGTWYAVVELFERVGEGHDRVVDTYHRACDGRDAAERACKEMTVAIADKMTANRSLQISIETDLAWEEADRWSNEG